jgi:hypothetical protein
MTLATVAHIANLASWPLILWMMLSRSGERRPAKELRDGSVEFAPAPFALWIWLLIILPSASTAWITLHRKINSPVQLMNSGIIVLFALSHLLSFPETIRVSREGLEQIYWLWTNKHIRWEEIVEIKLIKGSSNLTIKAGDGTCITYTSKLGGYFRLLREIKQRCGDNLPLEFPGEPTATLQSDSEGAKS